MYEISDVPALAATIYALDNSLANRAPVIILTDDGRILPGPGLSMDEATQGTARMLSEHYNAEAAILRHALTVISEHGHLSGTTLADIARRVLAERPSPAALGHIVAAAEAASHD